MHEPEPLHVPLVPQLAAPVSEHSLAGSSPAAIAPHVPSLPEPFTAAVQAVQTPLQDVLQQTPSTQNPVWHCESDEHALPALSWEQTPPEQLPDA